MEPRENILNMPAYKALKTDKQQRSFILKQFRAQDESHLYPIRNRFNATERAINRMRKFERETGYYMLDLELILFLDNEISEIVNSEV